MPVQSINIAELVADKIKTRYAEISEATFGSQNMVVDAFYPTYVRQSLTNRHFAPNLSKKVSCISPFLAKELNCFQIPIEDLIRMLGYSKIQLKTILESVKAKNLELVLVGLGGTGMNFMHWATELCNYTNSINVFESIYIYDEDKIDLTNLFRFPMILDASNMYHMTNTNSLPYKLDCINRDTILSRTRMTFNHEFITINTLSDNGTYIRPYWKNKILYGAPDIQTREMFSTLSELQFVSATHGNDDCQLYIKPPQDSNMQMESYGMINLSVFFMNQLKMTIAFFELLNSSEDLTVSSLIMDYSFAKEYANGNIIRSGLNRTYNFPINEHNFVDQEAVSVQEEIETAPQMSTEVLETILEVANMISPDHTNDLLRPPPPPHIIPETVPYAEAPTPVAVRTTARRRRTPAEMAEARARGEAPPYRPRRHNLETLPANANPTPFIAPMDLPAVPF